MSASKFKFDYGKQEFEGRNDFLWYVETYLDDNKWDHETDNTERYHFYTKEWEDNKNNDIKATIEADARNRLNNVDFILYKVDKVKKNGFEADVDVEEALEEFEDALGKTEKKMKGSKSAKHSP